MSKVRQIETSIDEARKNKDWTTALSHVKRYSKVNANGGSILEEIISAESLLEKDPAQSKTTLSKVLAKEPTNEVTSLIRFFTTDNRTHFRYTGNFYLPKIRITLMLLQISPKFNREMPFIIHLTHFV
jgi:hypothetical protein